MVTYSSIITKCRRVIGNDHMILVFLAMIAGGLAGCAVTLFREFIALIQALLFGSTSERLFVNADALAWWKILLVPVVGGLVVGAVVHFLLPQKRPHGVADVIEASALKGGGGCHPGRVWWRRWQAPFPSAPAPRWAAKARRCIWAPAWPGGWAGGCI